MIQRCPYNGDIRKERFGSTKFKEKNGGLETQVDHCTKLK